MPTDTGSPCTRPAGHRHGSCMSVEAYAAAIVCERETILGYTSLLEACLLRREMRGVVVMVGPASLRSAVWLALVSDVDRDVNAFGKGVAEVFEMAVAPNKAPGGPERLRVRAREGLASFVLGSFPQLAGASDPGAQLAEHLASYRRRSLGSAVVYIDDVGGLATGLVPSEVLGWMQEISATVPVVLGTSSEGWARFRRYVVSVGRGGLVEEAGRPVWPLCLRGPALGA